MIKLYVNPKNNSKLIRSHNSFKNKSYEEMSEILKNKLRQGTTVLVKNKNTNPSPHRGSYYLLYLNEYESVYLFYLDLKNTLRIVYSGTQEKATETIYKFISNDTQLTILRSDNKRAYRVMRNEDSNNIQPTVYKNKDGQSINQVYMTLFEAINLSVVQKKHNPNDAFAVISKTGAKQFIV